MSTIVLIFILGIINFLQISSSPVPDTFTIREKFNKVVETDQHENITIIAGYRSQDKDCLEDLLKLKNPGTEITKKFRKNDVEMILEGAASICNDKIQEEGFRRIIKFVKPFDEKFLDPDINCYKNELYKLEPTSTVLDGFTPNQEFEDSEVCKQKALKLNNDVEGSTNKLRKLSDYPQCLTPVDSFNTKVIELKLAILYGDDITDQKVKEEVVELVKYIVSSMTSIFKCIMDEVSNST